MIRANTIAKNNTSTFAMNSNAIHRTTCVKNPSTRCVLEAIANEQGAALDFTVRPTWKYCCLRTGPSRSPDLADGIAS
jgi:hypothetical protein